MLSIVIPAYNEAERVGKSLAEIMRYLKTLDFASEVILVDDGSKDETAQISREVFAEFPEIPTNLIRYEENRGKGFAVKTGLQAAKYEFALFSDADLSTPIDETPKLLKPLQDGLFDVTFGSRAIDRSLIGTRQPWRREQGGRVMNLIIRTASGLPFSDTQCGFKAFNMKAFRPLLDVMTVDRFGFDVEFLYVANFNKLRLKEIPVRWNDVEGSKVNVFRDSRRMLNELSQIRRNAKKGVYNRG